MEHDDVAALVADRKTKHGDFNDHARISQALTMAMVLGAGAKKWGSLSDTQREGLEMIQHKVGRILAGNADLAEHWEDIEGYARITRERLPK